MKSFNLNANYEDLIEYLKELDTFDSLKFKFVGDKILIFSKANTFQVMSVVYMHLDEYREVMTITDYVEDLIKTWSKESNVIISVTTSSKNIRFLDFDVSHENKIYTKLEICGKIVFLTLFPSETYELLIEDEEIIGDFEQILKVISELERKYYEN